MIVAAVHARITVNSGADETCQVSEEIGLREGIRISERRIAASVVAMVREIKPDMSPRESDKLWPLSTPLDPSVLLLESPCPYFTQSLVLNMSQKRTFARVLIKKRQPLLK